MPDFDANVHANSLAGARTGGGVEPVAALAAAARYLDVIVALVGAAVALALGGPVFGLLVGAAAWLLQRALALLSRRLIASAAEPGSRLGLNFVDAFARIWLLAGAIILAGVAGHRADGLAAALVIFAAYSIAFAVRISRGRAGGPA
jgi:hypothetical protein